MPPRLLRRASAALAEAKATDGAPVRVLEAGAESATARGDRLEVDLRRALDQDEIEIRFQPQVSVADRRDRRRRGAGALAPPPIWRARRDRPCSASPSAPTISSSSPTMCSARRSPAAAAWPEALAGLRLSVNITAADIVRPGFAALFLALVARKRLRSGPAHRRGHRERPDRGSGGGRGSARRLRGGGLRVAIDDFGTGYSSLAYLKALPLDYLKIDKRLCQDIAGSMRDRIVVRSVIDMARSLGLDVIAEGVETEEQLGLLAQEGCTLYQGFLCAPPVGVEELETLVVRH